MPDALAARPAWSTLPDFPARLLLAGVRTRGSAGTGRREWYGPHDLRPVDAVSAVFEGEDLGVMAPITTTVALGPEERGRVRESGKDSAPTGDAWQDCAVPTESEEIELSEHELREIAGYAADCARRTLSIFEQDRAEQDLAADTRPCDAIDAADAFAGGGRRTAALRQSAWAAYKAAQEAASPAAVDAARAASHAAGAAFLHPLANAHQVKHILGAAAHAARAEELASGEDRSVAAGSVTARSVTAGTLEWARRHAPPSVTAVLGRFPAAPPGGGRVGEFIRDLDTALRA